MLVLAAAGYTAEGTASKLGISHHTVLIYLRQAKDKLGATTKANAVALYLRGTGDDHGGERVGADDQDHVILLAAEPPDGSLDFLPGAAGHLGEAIDHLPVTGREDE